MGVSQANSSVISCLVVRRCANFPFSRRIVLLRRLPLETLPFSIVCVRPHARVRERERWRGEREGEGEGGCIQMGNGWHDEQEIFFPSLLKSFATSFNNLSSAATHPKVRFLFSRCAMLPLHMGCHPELHTGKTKKKNTTYSRFRCHRKRSG